MAQAYARKAAGGNGEIVPWAGKGPAQALRPLYVVQDVTRSSPSLTITDQPTYYHFHVHIVHVALEAGATQATGKALGLENIISQLEHMAGPEETAGMADLSLTYTVGEASELWTEIFQPLRGSGDS